MSSTLAGPAPSVPPGTPSRASLCPQPLPGRGPCLHPRGSHPTPGSTGNREHTGPSTTRRPAHDSPAPRVKAPCWRPEHQAAPVGRDGLFLPQTVPKFPGASVHTPPRGKLWRYSSELATLHGREWGVIIICCRLRLLLIKAPLKISNAPCDLSEILSRWLPCASNRKLTFSAAAL